MRFAGIPRKYPTTCRRDIVTCIKADGRHIFYKCAGDVFMDCRTRIVSNDYADLMVDFDLDVRSIENTAGDFCFYQIEDNLRIFYVNRDELPDLSVSDYR